MSKRSHAARRRHKAMIRRQTPPGAPPGTLVADPSAPKPLLHIVAYGPDGFREVETEDPEALAAYIGKWPALWVHVEGLGDAQVIGRLGSLFNLHQLALEDVLHTHQRPKVEQYPDSVYVVVRPLVLNDRLESEQMSLFLGKGFVVSFQERRGEGPDDPVRERIRLGAGRIRSEGTDFLAYALLDAVIDGCFPILERYWEKLAALEENLLVQPTPTLVARIHESKRDLLAARRSVWPLRDALSILYREPSPFLGEEVRVYLRDCYDHVIQIIDVVETFREVVLGMTDLYLSSLSNRMNEIMKVLTIISTIFIPLSFIAGLYGMNFDRSASPLNMPELGWKFGYPFALGLMGVTAVALLVFFRWKGWMGGGDRGAPADRPPRGEGD
ncbi:MAG: magnesium/cobalt transporter CorA [Acidobacteriota bacterium]